MKEFLLVFLGGGTGSILRYSISLITKRLPLEAFVWFPTLIANILGCFLIGLFFHNSQKWGLSTDIRLLLTTGLCGGFTTFSTFSYEGLTLLRQGQYTQYALYLSLSIILGILAAFLPQFLIPNS